ncbi:MAG: lipoprotein insertase outer membrane protein LolB [Gammaproteobacteria bacterium]
MILRSAAYIALLLFLTACSFVAEMPIGEYQLTAMQAMPLRKQWMLEGRLAFTGEKDSVSASIVWRHTELRDDIELIGPLAQGRVGIVVSLDQVTIDNGENLQTFHGDPNKILAEQLGMDVPVTALKYWVLGVNDPGQTFVEQSSGFYQDGWLVSYREMQKIQAELLPKKITAQKDKARIKLIVDRWDLL